VPKSLFYALLLALVYGTVATAYILVSSSMAADHSASVDELRRIEVQKGLIYVAVTTAGAFAACWLALRRMAEDGQELLRRERALVASQGKALAGAMAASIAHDANNVLTTVLGDLAGLEANDPHTRDTHLVHLRGSVDRLIDLNRRLVQAARNGVPHDRRACDLARVVRDSVAAVRSHHNLRHARIVVRGPEQVPAESQPTLLHQIVSNLLLNAGDATEGRGHIDVVLHTDGERFVLEVHDNGPGVARERHGDLFDRLATTKANGAGLGLFSVRACAHGLGGDAEVGVSPLGGALFRVTLPLSAPKPAPVA
jgi:two-component system sensor histidine kinase HydH